MNGENPFRGPAACATSGANAESALQSNRQFLLTNAVCVLYPEEIRLAEEMEKRMGRA